MSYGRQQSAISFSYVTVVVVAALLFIPLYTWAQPTICQAPVDMVPFCNEACIICDIDGFTGRHDSEVRGETPPGFCVFGTENAQWIAFLAGSTNLTVDIAVDNCDNFFLFSGLQMAIYESNDCMTYSRVSNCIGFLTQIREGQTGRLTTFDNLTVGQYYYLVMDGAAGDNCDWTMTVVDGSTSVDPLVTGGELLLDSIVCARDTVSIDVLPEVGATVFEWEIDSVVVSSAQSWDTVLTEPGTYVFCLTSSNVCNDGPRVCDSITVEPLLIDTVSRFICAGSCYETADTVLCSAGTYDVILSSTDGCDTTASLTIVEIPQFEITIDTTICIGDCIVVVDSTICDPGVYSLVLPGRAGACDTSLLASVVEAGEILVGVQASICQGDCFMVSDTSICDAGLFILNRSSAMGCDTVYTILLDRLDTSFAEIDTVLCFGTQFFIDGIELMPPITYRQIREGSNTCDSTINWTIDVLPIDTLLENYTICSGDSVVIDGLVVTEGGLYPTRRSAVPCSLVVLSLVDVLVIDTVVITDVLCFDDTIRIGNQSFVESGTYLVSLVGQSGCDSIVELNLEDQLLPFVRLSTVYACEGDTVELAGQVINETTFDTLAIPRVGACDSLLIVDVEFVDCDIVVVRNVRAVGCDGIDDGEIEIVWGGGLPRYTVQLLLDSIVVREDDFLTGTSFTFESLPSGDYDIRVIDRLGNVAVLDAVIGMPIPLLIDISTSDYTGFEISCEGATDGSIVVNAVSSNGPVEVFFGNGIVGPVADNLTVGTYTIMVADSLGCIIDTSITLLAPSPPQIDLFVEALPCSADTAAFVFGSIFNQLPITSATYNGEESTGVSTWAVPQDMQGPQVVMVTDANGCVESDSVVVDVPSPSVFDVVDTVYVTQGDSIIALLEWEDIISTVEWSGGGLSCAACLVPTVSLPGTNLVSVEITDMMGCVTTRIIAIVVEEGPAIILANIFSPNGDNINDVFEVAHPTVAVIEHFAVYDRWGQLVYMDQSGQRRAVWDGVYRGKQVESGVYVYYLRYIDTTSGLPKTKSGSLTVVQ